MTARGKRSVIVLAANSALGLGLVESLLSQEHYEVFGTYRRDASELTKVFSGHYDDPTHHVLRADLRSYSETHNALNIAGMNYPLWGVVNLAGTASAARLVALDASEAESVLLDNVMPALNSTKAAFELMPCNSLSGGRVVHVSSVTVRRPVPGIVPYVAGKAAVEGIVRAAAEEGGRNEITINALRLGYFASGMGAAVPKQILDRVTAATAVRRLGLTNDLDSALKYLLGASSSFQTGAVVDLDGGLI